MTNMGLFISSLIEGAVRAICTSQPSAPAPSPKMNCQFMLNPFPKNGVCESRQFKGLGLGTFSLEFRHA